MLRPTPARIMRGVVTVKVCNGTDRYQTQTYDTYTVERVHVQPTNEIRKTENNTDCTLRGILFVDAHTSTPSIDWYKLLQDAHAKQGDMRVTVTDANGNVIGEFTVIGCDALRDDTDVLHHWEVALI